MIDYAEPSPGILTLPLLDRAACETVMTRSEDEAWVPAGVVGKANKGQSHVNVDMRQAALRFFERDTDIWHLLHEKIDGVVRPLVQARWKRDFPNHSTVQIVRYPPGGFYRAHRDSGPYNEVRYFTVVCYLNDDYEGGGTYFPDAAYTVVPEQGKTVLFPADYLHQAEPVRNGTKYVAVIWLLAPPPTQWM